jgi:hypothetical protein
MSFYSFANNADAITKIDIYALRQCDVVSFHHDTVSYISVTKRESFINPFGATRRINCNTRFVDYSDKNEQISKERMKCFDMIHSPKVETEWQTIVSLLKEGDVLRLHWQRNALQSEALKEVGFCGDKLSLLVTRGKREMEFFLHAYCGANNTARMIQGPRKGEEYI